MRLTGMITRDDGWIVNVRTQTIGETDHLWYVVRLLPPADHDAAPYGVSTSSIREASDAVATFLRMEP